MAELNLCDYHIHTRYSSDSTEEPENIIRHAIELGLDEICFTDHTDLDYQKHPTTKTRHLYLIPWLIIRKYQSLGTNIPGK